ncbi:glycosyltransferase [Corynebacterium resistens]|uniref:glycosyltransferase n=1 Tax=Corynebacterium resistens TaxID=258224 RepID=UPI002354BC89|nr:glycosyltransferase [Corynebacterium resistens]
MRILHVINNLATGGAEMLVVNMAEEARRAGHTCSIAVLADAPGVPKDRAQQLGLDVIQLGSSLYDPRNVFRIRRLASKFDVVHVHLFPAMYVASFAGKNLFFTEHNSSNRRMESAAWRFVERFVYRRYTALVAISVGVKQALTSYLDGLGVRIPVELVMNGVSEDYFTVSRPVEGFNNKLVFVGSLKDSKDPALALEVVSHIPELELFFAGDGPLRPELEERARSFQIEDRVHFLGITSDVKGVFEKVGALLSTSRVEGFGLVAAEAEGTGIPVVGPNLPGLNEVVLDGRTGLLFDERDPREIADLVNRLEDKDFYTKISAAAREHARNFSISRTFQNYLSVYKSYLNR